jgi:hypothetical protein
MSDCVYINYKESPDSIHCQSRISGDFRSFSHDDMLTEAYLIGDNDGIVQKLHTQCMLKLSRLND